MDNFIILAIATAFVIVLCVLLVRVRDDWRQRRAAKRIDEALARRQPPTMPPRRPPLHWEPGPKISDSFVDARILQMVKNQAESHSAHLHAAVVAKTGDAGLDAILNAPEPGPTATPDEVMRGCLTPREYARFAAPARARRADDDRRHSSDVDPMVPLYVANSLTTMEAARVPPCPEPPPAFDAGSIDFGTGNGW